MRWGTQLLSNELISASNLFGALLEIEDEKEEVGSQGGGLIDNG